MARLTQSNKVGLVVRLGGRIEISERLLVMHGQRRSDVLFTLMTTAALFSHDILSRLAPSSSAVGFGSSDIARRQASNEAGGSEEARATAEAGYSILSSHPRFLRKLLMAMFARQFQSISPSGISWAANFVAHKGVGRFLSNAESIAAHVGFCSCIQPAARVPLPAARERTKSSPIPTIRLNQEDFGTNFARFRDHVLIVTHWLAKAITCRRIEEAARQPDMFIEKPKAAIQESFL